MANDIKIRLDLVAAQAQQDIDRVRKSLDGTADGLEEVEGAGKVMARALAAAADEVEASIEQMNRKADALANALGPEMAAKIGRNKIDQFAAQLQKASLTTEEVEADVDSLAAELVRLDDVGSRLTGVQRGMLDIDDSVDRVGKSTERTRGAMSNFAGNAVSELPAVGEAFGPVSQGLGEMIEGLAGSEMGLKHVLAAGLAMGVVGAVFVELTDKSEELEDAAREAMRTDRVEAWSEALRDAVDPVEALRAKLAEGGRAYVQMFAPGGDPIWADWTARFNAAGITLDDWAGAIATGTAGVDDMQARLAASNLTAFEQQVILQTLAEEQRIYAEAARYAGDSTAYAGDTIKGATAQLEDAVRALDTYEGGTRDAADANDEMADSTRDSTDALEELQGVLDGIDASNTVLDLADQFDKAKAASDAAWAAMGADAADTDRKLRDAQRSTNALKEEVITYGSEVLKLPASKITELLAMIDEGYLEEAQAELDRLTESRNMSIIVRLTGDGVPYLGRASGDFDRKASGGMATGGPTLVGEHGPELRHDPAGTRYESAGDTARALGAGYESPASVHHHYSLGNPTPAAVAELQRRHSRRNGAT